MNSAASERKSNEFWSTCSPSPSYMLIQRCCHKLRKINSVQSVGPGWKHDSISNTTFLIETKTHKKEQRTRLVMLECSDGFFFFFWTVFVTSKITQKEMTFSLTLWPILAARWERKKDFLQEIKDSWISNHIYTKQQLWSIQHNVRRTLNITGYLGKEM